MRAVLGGEPTQLEDLRAVWPARVDQGPDGRRSTDVRSLLWAERADWAL